jgi:hypothetical protein
LSKNLKTQTFRKQKNPSPSENVYSFWQRPWSRLVSRCKSSLDIGTLLTDRRTDIQKPLEHIIFSKICSKNTKITERRTTIRTTPTTKIIHSPLIASSAVCCRFSMHSEANSMLVDCGVAAGEQ